MPFYHSFPIQGDLEFTPDGKDLALLAGAAKVAQSIRIRAGIFRGSWRYDRTRGVPYFQDILVAGAQIEVVRRTFHRLLAETDGVDEVRRLAIRFEQSTQTIYVDFEVLTESGLTTGVLDFVAA